jgi:hypothetical protein
MNGYAVTGRIEGVAPRIVRRGSPSFAPSSTVDARELDTVDLVGRPIDEEVAEAWGRVRDAWTQTTFFLFDPESWR